MNNMQGLLIGWSRVASPQAHSLLPQFRFALAVGGASGRRHCSTKIIHTCTTTCPVPAVYSQRTPLHERFLQHTTSQTLSRQRTYSSKMSFSNTDTGSKTADPYGLPFTPSSQPLTSLTDTRQRTRRNLDLKRRSKT